MSIRLIAAAESNDPNCEFVLLAEGEPIGTVDAIHSGEDTYTYYADLPDSVNDTEVRYQYVLREKTSRTLQTRGEFALVEVDGALRVEDTATLLQIISDAVGDITLPEPEPEPEPEEPIEPEEPKQPKIGTSRPTPVIGHRRGDVEKILSKVRASRSQQQVQMSPIDTQHGYVYTVHIEPGPKGDSNDSTLRTVLRQGVQEGGRWRWSEKLIDPRTVQDKWHTAPSVIVDKAGYIHVSGNMHNTPWQYWVSDNPHDISSFTFRGHAISQSEIDKWKIKNRTYFPDFGQGDIPGNQITYPRFQRDRNGDIYVTARFAAQPLRRFKERMMSSMIARYDTDTRQWTALGFDKHDGVSGKDFLPHKDAPKHPTLVAGKEGWTSYKACLDFGPDNEMWLNVWWRQGIAGSVLSRPSVFLSRDGGTTWVDDQGSPIRLPIRPEDSDSQLFANSQGFYTIGTFAVNQEGHPYLLCSPTGGQRRQILSVKDGRVHRQESPGNCTDIFFDNDNNMYACGTGLMIYRKDYGKSSWELVHKIDGKGDCFPRAVVSEDGTVAFIHTHACQLTTCSIYALRLK